MQFENSWSTSYTQSVITGSNNKLEPAYELSEELTLYESDVCSNRNEPDQGISRNFPNNS